MIPPSCLEMSWGTYWFDEIDSTSLEAARRASEGQTGPFWIAAKKQTKGRGRLGRNWVSETGNLYATALVPIEKVDANLPSIALTLGLSVRDAFLGLSGETCDPRVKWPNDVRIDGAKISGILIETGNTPDGQGWISFGIGLNLSFSPDIANYRTTSLLAESGVSVSPEDALGALDRALRQRLRQHIHVGRQSIIDDWLEATDQHGQICRTQQNGVEVEGLFLGLDDYGQMQLQTENGETRTISAGDVELVGRR